jgi:hypothetical protein
LRCANLYQERWAGLGCSLSKRGFGRRGAGVPWVGKVGAR